MSKLKKALEKAKEARGFESEALHRNNKILKPIDDDKSFNGTACRPELEICYSDTKTKKIDDSVLKRGKVISLFHGIEKIEQIKTLRTQVLNHLNQVGGSSILITSANPYEGKTFTAINLGVSIAQ